MTISLRTWLPRLTLSSLLLTATIAMAEPIKTYQVTGPVVEVTDSTITVMKGKEKWQLARDKDTKVTGELKVGAKVTIQYSMTATTVEAKSDGKSAGKDANAAKTEKDKPAKK